LGNFGGKELNLSRWGVEGVRTQEEDVFRAKSRTRTETRLFVPGDRDLLSVEDLLAVLSVVEEVASKAEEQEELV